MATYKVTELAKLSSKLVEKASRIDSMIASTLNATATYTRKQSVDEITAIVLLETAYVQKYLKVSRRASPNNLTAEIWANDRATLLTRYPFIRSKEGIKSRVNRKSGYSLIPGSFYIGSLRVSNAAGIAMRNSVFYEYYKTQVHDTPGKKAKLKRAEIRARDKPKGITVLHSRSINQLFNSVRNDVRPAMRAFMVANFKERLNK